MLQVDGMESANNFGLHTRIRFCLQCCSQTFVSSTSCEVATARVVHFLRREPYLLSGVSNDSAFQVQMHCMNPFILSILPAFGSSSSAMQVQVRSDLSNLLTHRVGDSSHSRGHIGSNGKEG